MSPLTSISKIYYAFLTAYLLIPSITASTSKTYTLKTGENKKEATYTLKTGENQEEKTYTLCITEVTEKKLLITKKKYEYSFQEIDNNTNKNKTDNNTDNNTNNNKKLTCKEFIRAGSRYVTDPSATNLFHDLINAISNTMVINKIDTSRSYNLEASIEKKNQPIIFKLQILTNLQQVFQAPDRDLQFDDSHFNKYFNKRNDSALAITSLSRNILIVPKSQLDTLSQFNNKASEEEKRHLWTLLFSFLFKYSRDIYSISLKTKAKTEQAMRHLHVRLKTSDELKEKIEKKKVIGMYTTDHRVILPKEGAEGFLVPDTPSSNKSEEKESVSSERNITIPTTPSSRLSNAMPSLNFFLLLFLIGTVLWLIKKIKKMPVQSPTEDTSSNTYPKQ